MCGWDLALWYGGVISLGVGSALCVYGWRSIRQSEAREVLMDAREAELNHRSRETEKKALRRFGAKFSEWLQSEENQ